MQSKDLFSLLITQKTIRCYTGINEKLRNSVLMSNLIQGKDHSDRYKILKFYRTILPIMLQIDPTKIVNHDFPHSINWPRMQTQDCIERTLGDLLFTHLQLSDHIFFMGESSQVPLFKMAWYTQFMDPMNFTQVHKIRKKYRHNHSGA